MWGGIFDRNHIKDKILALDKKVIHKDFWKDNLSAQKVLKEKKFLENVFENFNSTINELENLEQLNELAVSENDSTVIKDCSKKIDLFFN